MLRRRGDDLPTESLQIVAAVNKTIMQGDHQEMMENFKPKAQGTIPRRLERPLPTRRKLNHEAGPSRFLNKKAARLTILENNH